LIKAGLLASSSNVIATFPEKIQWFQAVNSLVTVAGTAANRHSLLILQRTFNQAVIVKKIEAEEKGLSCIIAIINY